MRINKLGLLIMAAILTFGFWVACSGEAKAQTDQIEGKLIYHPNLEKFTSTDGYGGGLELTTHLGEYIKLLQRFDIEKSREGDTRADFRQRDITLQSTVRLYPVEGYAAIKPFVQGGVRARFTRYNSTATIPLPGGPGTLRSENKFTFASPFLGVGVNYKDYYILEYSYYLPDFASELKQNIMTGAPIATFFHERGHYLRAKGFVPIGAKFAFNPSYEVYRRKTDGLAPAWDQSLSFGLAYRFGETTN